METEVREFKSLVKKVVGELKNRSQFTRVSIISVLILAYITNALKCKLRILQISIQPSTQYYFRDTKYLLLRYQNSIRTMILVEKGVVCTHKKEPKRGSWLPQSGGHVTLDLEVVGSSPMLGV